MKKKNAIALALASVFMFSTVCLMAGCGKEDESGNEPDNPGIDNPVTPGGDNPETPGGDNPETPGGNNPETPGGNNPEPPGGDDPVTPKDEWHNQSIWLEKGSLLPTEGYVLPTKADGTWRNPSEVAVHDPSVFQDPADGIYYAFGTHFAVASSEELVHWEQEVSDEQPQELYGDQMMAAPYASFPQAIADTVNLVKPSTSSDGIKTTWAPDVEYINGKYYMYYSLTKAFGSRESAIARVEADNVMGPYSNNVILLDSMGGSGLTPNCIDPELFYDKEGKLWMVYGSSFGGIYIIELNTEGDKVGLPKEEGYGKLIWRAGNNVEGPFIFYNATTEYYYLMTSYNSLQTNYNMRIVRSKNPDGPYVGVDGKDVAVDGNGNNIAGNFKFTRMGTEPEYRAMGHNSVIKDAEGRYIVVYHVRRQANGGHHLYTSRMLFNEEDWPVMSPLPYVGENAGTVQESDLTKTFEIVLHKPDSSGTVVRSEDYTLAADGTVTKSSSQVGTWELKSNYYVEITINSVTYKGVAVSGWDSYAASSKQKGVLGFTAVSNAGQSLWAIEK